MDPTITLRPTGIATIDEQHKTLLGHLDRLSSWAATGFALPATFDALQAVVDYTKTHFQHEEDILRERGYPKLDEHAREHAELVGKVADLQKQLEDGGDITRLLVDTLRSWIVTHIDQEDIEYAEFFGTAPRVG